MLPCAFAAIYRPGGKGSQGFIGGVGAVRWAQLSSSQGRAVAHQEGPYWNHHRSVPHSLALTHELLLVPPPLLFPFYIGLGQREAQVNHGLLFNHA